MAPLVRVLLVFFAPFVKLDMLQPARKLIALIFAQMGLSQLTKNVMMETVTLETDAHQYAWWKLDLLVLANPQFVNQYVEMASKLALKDVTIRIKENAQVIAQFQILGINVQEEVVLDHQFALQYAEMAFEL